MRIRRASRIGTLGAWLACLFIAQRFIPPSIPEEDTFYSDAGEALLQSLPVEGVRVSAHMPLASLLHALHSHRQSPAAAALWMRGYAALLTSLIYWLGWMLGGVPGAMLAVVAALADPSRAPTLGYLAYFFYTILILLVAGMLAWRGRSPSWKSSLWLGAAIGVSLLFRSSLAFFGPALAIFEAWAYRRSWRASRGTVLALCVVPYLFLTPWLRMNWLLQHRIVPFEDGQADCNIVTGALGIVPTITENWEALIDAPLVDHSSSGVLRWAAREVLRHPWRYARSVAARVGYVVSLHPILSIAATAARGQAGVK
jgi:hypothetical protein